MARYYFEIKNGGDYPIYDRDAPWERTEQDFTVTCTPHLVGTLHDVVLAERVVDLLNQYEEKFDGR